MKLLVESEPDGVRMGVLDGGRLVEYHAERLESSRVGDIYLGRVRRLAPAIDAVFVDIGLKRNAFLHAADFRLAENETLEVHQPIVVQVYRDALPGKGVRVRRGATLPGRYLVLAAPGSGVSVSTRIEGESERTRLAEAVSAGASEEVGWIVRTAAEGVAAEVLEADAADLLETWQGVARAAGSTRPVRRLHRDLHPLERWLRDHATREIGEIWVEDAATLERTRAILAAIAPFLEPRIRLHEGAEPLFEHFGVERQVEEILEPRVKLPSGGSLVIESTEALVAIDINSGGDLGAETLEETALVTNLEAASEVARQIRLRDLAGILVVDFIDLADDSDWEQVMSTLVAGLGRDKAATQVEGPVAFGLVAITRKRGRNDLLQRSTVPCDQCGGSGRVRAAHEVLAAARRALLASERRRPGRSWLLKLPSRTLGNEREDEPQPLGDLRASFGRRLELEVDSKLAAGSYELVEVAR